MVKNKIFLQKEYHISFESINALPYYEYECLIDLVNNNIREEQKEQKKQNEQMQGWQNGIKYPKMSNMPAMPKMPTFNMPKF